LAMPYETEGTDTWSDDFSGLHPEVATERRFGRLENWARYHDRTCATRWGILLWVIGAGGTIFATAIVSMIGWALSTLHADQQKQIDLIQRALSAPPSISRPLR
jgi:hypothetical protein